MSLNYRDVRDGSAVSHIAVVRYAAADGSGMFPDVMSDDEIVAAWLGGE